MTVTCSGSRGAVATGAGACAVDMGLLANAELGNQPRACRSLRGTAGSRLAGRTRRHGVIRGPTPHLCESGAPAPVGGNVQRAAHGDKVTANRRPQEHLMLPL